jgi:hypothetical protein
MNTPGHSTKPIEEIEKDKFKYPFASSNFLSKVSTNLSRRKRKFNMLCSLPVADLRYFIYKLELKIDYYNAK